MTGLIAKSQGVSIQLPIPICHVTLMGCSSHAGCMCDSLRKTRHSERVALALLVGKIRVEQSRVKSHFLAGPRSIVDAGANLICI